jgi:soluble lytic murein transglycosylase-like protein
MRVFKSLTILLTLAAMATSAGTATAQEIERSWKDRLTEYVADTYKISNAKTIVDIVIDISESRNVEPSLVLAMISVESGFNPKARNISGAKGLMQVMTPLHSKRFPSHHFYYDPMTNIEVGLDIWQECEARSKSFNQAAKCYSGGSLTWAKKVKTQQQKFDKLKEFL